MKKFILISFLAVFSLSACQSVNEENATSLDQEGAVSEYNENSLLEAIAEANNLNADDLIFFDQVPNEDANLLAVVWGQSSVPSLNDTFDTVQEITLFTIQDDEPSITDKTAGAGNLYYEYIQNVRWDQEGSAILYEHVVTREDTGEKVITEKELTAKGY